MTDLAMFDLIRGLKVNPTVIGADPSNKQDST